MARMKRHWRYLLARWGAHPAIWCLAGEGTMPYYLAADKERDRAMQKRGWTPGGSRDCALHRGLLGVLSADPGNGQDEAALALPARALGRASGDLVPGGRGHHALLPCGRQRARPGDAEARMD